MNIIVNMDTAVKLIYTTVKNERTKERHEMILEPLQAMIQLAALSYYPSGTKLSIINNILILQEPSWTQGILRSYNADKKDDLIYLFSVIKRFHLFYTFLTVKDFTSHELFTILIHRGKLGVDKLIKTYSKTNKQYLTQTLSMYKTLLDTPEAFSSGKKLLDTSSSLSQESESVYESPPNINEKIFNSPENMNKLKTNTVITETESEKNINIDNVFEQITGIYTDMHYNIILNNFKLMNEDQINYKSYINGINNSLEPLYSKINIWITENIIF